MHPRLTFASERRGLSKARVRRNELHGGRKERRCALFAPHPGVDHVGPFLQHVSALISTSSRLPNDGTMSRSKIVLRIARVLSAI